MRSLGFRDLGFGFWVRQTNSNETSEDWVQDGSGSRLRALNP